MTKWKPPLLWSLWVQHCKSLAEKLRTSVYIEVYLKVLLRLCLWCCTASLWGTGMKNWACAASAWCFYRLCRMITHPKRNTFHSTWASVEMQIVSEQFSFYHRKVTFSMDLLQSPIVSVKGLPLNSVWLGVVPKNGNKAANFINLLMWSLKREFRPHGAKVCD